MLKFFSISLILLSGSLGFIRSQCNFSGNLTVNSNDSVCPGSTYNLFATGADSYTWSPDSILFNSNTSFPNTIELDQTVMFYVTAFDTENCSTTDSVEIFVFSDDHIFTLNDSIICPGSSIELNAYGGISYIWTNNISLSNFLISNPIASPTQSTTYLVEITDSNNCKFNDSIFIDLFNEPNANAGFDAIICPNETHLLEGSGGVIYNWEPSDYVNHADSSDVLCFPETDMEFVLEITDSNGCNDFDTVQILIFEITVSNDTILCSGDSVNLMVLGDPSTEFLWSPYYNISDSSSSNPWVSPLMSTNYKVLATNSQGCIDSDSIYIEVSQVSAVIDTSLIIGCNNYYLKFMNSSFDSLDFYWSFSDDSKSYEREIEKKLNFESYIQSNLIVENNLGCKDSVSLSVNSLNLDSFFDFDELNPPNIFTPNGDGTNDLFEVSFPGRINECVNLTVYNKWGETQFSSTGNNIYWDGYTNTGTPASQGIYFYTLSFKNSSKSGFLQLIR